MWKTGFVRDGFCPGWVLSEMGYVRDGLYPEGVLSAHRTKSDPEKGDASINYKATRKHLGIRILPEIRVTKKFLRDSLAV